jgi:hypothetical protein
VGIRQAVVEHATEQEFHFMVDRKQREKEEDAEDRHIFSGHAPMVYFCN